MWRSYPVYCCCLDVSWFIHVHAVNTLATDFESWASGLFGNVRRKSLIWNFYWVAVFSLLRISAVNWVKDKHFGAEGNGKRGRVKTFFNLVSTGLCTFHGGGGAWGLIGHHECVWVEITPMMHFKLLSDVNNGMGTLTSLEEVQSILVWGYFSFEANRQDRYSELTLYAHILASCYWGPLNRE